MNTYIFFFEGEDPMFEIKAFDYDDAYEKAYDAYGPQVDDMYYIKITNP